MATTIKTGKTWQDAMVQADMCLDSGDDAAADRWRLVGNVQDRLERLWTEGRNRWTATQLRKLPQCRRRLRIQFEIGERSFLLLAGFTRLTIVYDLFYRKQGYRTIGSTFVRRERLASNPDVVFREVAERLVK
jgi:hypothetical protein